jgi:hypothetical protein
MVRFFFRARIFSTLEIVLGRGDGPTELRTPWVWNPRCVGRCGISPKHRGLEPSPFLRARAAGGILPASGRAGGGSVWHGCAARRTTRHTAWSSTCGWREAARVGPPYSPSRLREDACRLFLRFLRPTRFPLQIRHDEFRMWACC